MTTALIAIVLEKGAIALAEALGAKVGDGLGQALVDAILGKTSNDGAFEREVLTRLAVIEQKLVEVLKILRDDLPIIVDAAQIPAMADRAKGHRTACRMARSAFEGSDSFLDAYFEEVRNVAKDGIAIGNRHPEWAHVVIEIFALAASCLSHLLHHDMAIKASLVTLADDYQEMFEPWIAQPSTKDEIIIFSYRNSLKEIELNLDLAVQAKANPQLINTEYYFAATGPFPVTATGDPAGPANHTHDVWNFFPGYTHVFGDRAENWTHEAHRAFVPIGTSVTQAATGLPHPLINWYPLLEKKTLPYSPARDHFAYLVGLARNLKIDSVALPPRVVELTSLIHSIEKAVEACKYYKEIKGATS